MIIVVKYFKEFSLTQSSFCYSHEFYLLFGCTREREMQQLHVFNIFCAELRDLQFSIELKVEELCQNSLPNKSKSKELSWFGEL